MSCAPAGLARWNEAARSLTSAKTPDNAGFVQIVGGHFQFDPVPSRNSDPAFSHFARNCREDDVLILQFHAEHGSGEDRLDAAFYFDVLFTHIYS